MWKSNTFSYFALTLALPIALAGCDKGAASAASAQAAAPKETVAAVSMTNPTDPKEQVFGLPRRNSESLTYPTSLDYNLQFHIGDATYITYLDLYWSQGYLGTDAALARTLFESYRNEDDGFKKQDILNDLKPELSAYLDKAKKLGNIKITTREKVHVNEYNHETKAFKFSTPNGGNAELKISERAFPPQTYTSYILMGSLPSAMEYRPSSESEARKIESAISSLKDRGSRSVALEVTVYGYVLQTYAMQEGTQFHSVIAADTFSLDHPVTKQPLILVKSSALPQVINLDELKVDSEVKDEIAKRFKVPPSVRETVKGVPHYW